MRQTYKCRTFKDLSNDLTTHKIFVFLMFLHRYVLKGFAKDGRDLTDKETKAFLRAADKDGDGKIGVDGKYSLVVVSRVFLTNLQKKRLQLHSRP